MADWEFSEIARRYRSKETGRFLSPSSAISLRDDFQQRRRSDIDALTRRLADQDITVQQFETEMQVLIKQTFGVQYAYGRGGRNAMTADDFTALDTLIRDQYQYLRAFAQDIAAGKLSEAQITARAGLYHGSSVRAYEQGKAASWGLQLPHYPADGSTPCKSACRCRWDIADRGDEIHATWHLQSGGESCPGCKSRAASYAPLVIAKAESGRSSRLWRMVA